VLVAAIEGVLSEVQAHAAIFNNAVGERLALSPSEIETLAMIERHGVLSAGEIARRTGFTTVTHLIDRLLDDGWVTRREDPQDRRRVLVELTAAGRRRLAPFYGPTAGIAGGVLASYADKELERILEFLERMRESGMAQTERVRAMPTSKPRRQVEIGTRVLGQKIRVRIR